METCGNLICTVGTSLLFPNLEHLDPETRFQKPLRPGDFHEAADYATVADLFTGFPPELRLLGAEINSIEAMVRKKYLPDDRSRLILLVSDTADGRAIGTILRRYFLHPDCPVGFCDCIVEKFLARVGKTGKRTAPVEKGNAPPCHQYEPIRRAEENRAAVGPRPRRDPAEPSARGARSGRRPGPRGSK